MTQTKLLEIALELDEDALVAAITETADDHARLPD
jgi:hypothetical protein